MIKCNLAVLLAERGLKMSDVIKDTKLAKNTVRSLYYNEAKGIQFNTLETLCDYLSIDIDDLFTLSQFNLSVKDILKINENFYKITILIETDKENFTDEILISYEHKPSNVIYPPPKDGETIPYYSIKISRKFYNTLLTLPEKRQISYLIQNILIPTFEKIGIDLEDNSYTIYVQNSNSNTYSEWHSYNKL